MTEDVKLNDPMGIQDAFAVTKAAIAEAKDGNKTVVSQEGVDAPESAPVQ